MTRLTIIVEGQTEESFVNQSLKPFLAEKEIMVTAHCFTTGRKKGSIYRGGIDNYEKIKNEIERTLKSDTTTYLTTMIDFYRLPKNFPGISEIKNKNYHEKIKLIETAFKNDIKNSRFIPYIQLHEFETLLLSDVDAIGKFFFESQKAAYDLSQEINGLDPETINDGASTAPSKRIITHIPQYERLKTTAGSSIAESIGLEILRKKCPHFHQWIEQIEKLEQTPL